MKSNDVKPVVFRHINRNTSKIPLTGLLDENTPLKITKTSLNSATFLLGFKN